MERKDIKYIEVFNEYKHLYSFIETFPKGKVCSFYLYGPPGTAKTTLAIKLAQDFGVYYEIVDGSEDLDRRDLEGVWNIQKENGTVFVPGALVKVIKKANEDGLAFLIMNEPNAIRTSEQVSFNSLLAEAQVNLISKAGERIELNKNAKLVVIGTMNFDVSGVNELQEAFKSRFYLGKEMNYPPKKKEILIVVEMGGCKKEVAELIVDVANQFRKAAKPPNFSVAVMFSTRLAVNFAQTITRMGVEFLNENIQDMIVNKLCEDAVQVEFAERLLQGKDFKNKLYDMFSEKTEEEKISIDEKTKEKITGEISTMEVVKGTVGASVKRQFTRTILKTWLRRELKHFCRDNGIHGYSKMNKDQVIDLILKHQEKERKVVSDLGISGLF